jgi:hypothetical protein
MCAALPATMVSDVIRQAPFQADPWCLRETALDLEFLAQGESVFALSNGHVGWRANLDEGEPHGLPGSYLNGVYEERPLPYAEAAYGLPQSGQTMINVANGKLIRLLVDDEPFEIRYGTLQWHLRLLDFLAGTLQRRLEWSSPSGRTVRIASTRVVSLMQRAVAAISYEVEPLDGTADVVLQSELVADEQLPPPALRRLPFTIVIGGRQLRVEATGDSASYTLSGYGPPTEISHHGERVLVATRSPQTRAMPPLKDRPEPVQPPGRAPARRTPPGPPTTPPSHTTAVSWGRTRRRRARGRQSSGESGWPRHRRSTSAGGPGARCAGRCRAPRTRSGTRRPAGSIRSASWQSMTIPGCQT